MNIEISCIDWYLISNNYLFVQDLLVPDETYRDMLAKGYKEQELEGDPGDQVCNEPYIEEF